ncbi:MAG: DUF952 domain-containing protein [Myxococcota bacterium]
MREPHGGPLYKIVPKADWDAAEGRIPWAPIDRSDGFIHLSAAHQVRETAARHFADRDDLVIVDIDPQHITPTTLRWEISRSGQHFPHVYGDIPRAAVGRVTPLSTVGETVRVDPHIPQPLGASPDPEAVARRLERAHEAYLRSHGDGGTSRLIVATRSLDAIVASSDRPLSVHDVYVRWLDEPPNSPHEAVPEWRPAGPQVRTFVGGGAVHIDHEVAQLLASPSGTVLEPLAMAYALGCRLATLAVPSDEPAPTESGFRLSHVRLTFGG